MGEPVARARVIHAGTTSTIVVQGEIDVSSAGVIEDAVDEARAAGCAQAVVDLRGVSFMDLSGLRVLHRAATDGLDVVIRNPSRLVCRVIDLAGMDGVLPIEFTTTEVG